jgi:hypothetical protein
MSIYGSTHARASTVVVGAGASVTFTLATPGTYDATTDTYSAPSTASVAGAAIRVAGDPKQYRALALVEEEAPTLFFTPTVFGQLPAPGYSVTWSGLTFVTRAVRPIAPDGTAIAARIVVSR